MSGTFASFNTALSALRYNRVVMDTASGNIANAATPGFTRRQVVGETVGAPVQPAMWSRYDGAGDGVRVADLRRMTDQFLDTRVRQETATLTYLDVRRTTLERLETGVAEPGPNGVSAALADFRSSWHALSNAPGSDIARTQVLTEARTLVDAVRTQAANVARETTDARTRLDGAVGEVNAAAAELAELNRQIAQHGSAGVDVNTLLDRRDQVATTLAGLTGGTATERADGGLDVTVGNVPLVQGRQAGTLVVSAPGAVPVTFEVRQPDGSSAAVTAAVRGEVGAGADLLSVTLPAYAAGLDAVAAQLAQEVNGRQAQGFDRAGNAGGPLLSYDPAQGAASLALVSTDPGRLAASSQPGALLGDVAASQGAASGVETAYQRLVNGLGTEVSSAGRLVTNQASLLAQVDGQRDQLSGVSLDEEMVTLMSAQRGYEAASRVMSTLDSMLDTLINRTGLVGR
ncbi:flagellar hook-associated protein FlgK [Nocardioides solisilvae]|uniref:flagellar hook-associated protein FlgK n=1 Tax=Nocardioides solisilvae TaxID=1542435 RepID=UPI000D7505FE|nr:flagellar hook-associated protein FlgK [Nocardioides solisilvae]